MNKKKLPFTIKLSLILFVLTNVFIFATFLIMNRNNNASFYNAIFGNAIITYLYLVHLFGMFTILEFVIKAWNKYYHNKNYKITFFSHAINIVCLFLPSLYYGAMCYIFKTLLGKKIKHSTLEIVSIVAFTIITLGLIWFVIVLLKYGLYKALGDLFPFTNKMSAFELVLLYVMFILIIPFLLIWLFIITFEYMFKKVWYMVLEEFADYSKRRYSVLFVLSIITGGIIPYFMFLYYGIFVFSLFIYKGSITNETDVKDA